MPNGFQLRSRLTKRLGPFLDHGLPGISGTDLPADLKKIRPSCQSLCCQEICFQEIQISRENQNQWTFCYHNPKNQRHC
jgi:hypothetical protein